MDLEEQGAMDPRVETLLDGLSEFVNSPPFIIRCRNIIHSLPEERLFTLPAFMLAAPKSGNEIIDGAVTYTTVAASIIASEHAGISRAVIMGRRVARDMVDGNFLESFKDILKTIRPMMATAAGMSIIVSALESAPQREAFKAVAKYVGIYGLEDAILMGALIGGIATGVIATASAIVEGAEIFSNSEFMNSARRHARDVARQSIEGCGNCIISAFGGQENFDRVSYRIGRVVDRASGMAINGLVRSILCDPRSDLAISFVISNSFDEGKWPSVGYASLSGYKTVCEAVESGYRFVENLSDGQINNAIKEISNIALSCATSAAAMGIIVSVLDSIPQQKAFEAVFEYFGYDDVDPILAGAVVGGVATGIISSAVALVIGIDKISNSQLMASASERAEEIANNVISGFQMCLQRSMSAVTGALAPSARVAVVNGEDIEGESVVEIRRLSQAENNNDQGRS